MPESQQKLLQPCPNCATLLDVTDEEPFAQVHCPICGTSMRVRRQFNSYAIEEVLGAGGMGAVYKAKDLNLNRMVALKLLNKEYSADAKFIRKFETEARITASINHPHVVKVFTFGSDHGLFYIVMELVDKGSLEHLIHLQGRIAESQVLLYGVQVAEGLHAACQKGLIHRDVKPGNILFADARTAKIVDFGLALLMEHEAEARGEVWGTPYYVAPEKLNKEPEDFRSDIYSLGCTLFHALAGRPPFDAETASMVALKHSRSKAVSLQAFAPHVSSETSFVINRMVRQDPEERYQSYEELIEHLSYARRLVLEAGAKPAGARARQKVVVDGGAQENVTFYVTLGLIGMLIAAAIVLVVFRDAIFKTGRQEPAQVTGQTESGSDLQAEYRLARENLLHGDVASAAEAFGELGQNPRMPEPLKNWALFHQGIALLLENRLDDALAAFKAVQKGAAFSPDPAHRSLVKLFENAGRLMSDREPVPGTVASSYSPANAEAMALLAFGLKDWQVGAFEDSLLFMNRFLGSDRRNSEQWVDGYRPLAETHRSDLELVVTLKAEAGRARTQEQKQEVLKRVSRARTKLKVGGKVAEELGRLRDSLEREIEAAQAEEKSRLEAGREAEVTDFAQLEKDFDALVAAYDFEAASRRAEAFQADFDPARRKVEILRKKANWLKEFISQLSEDVRHSPYTGPITRRGGGAVPGEVGTVTQEGLRVSSKYGSVALSWTQVPADLPGQMATYYMKQSPADTARRKWLLGVFSVSTGLPEEGRKLLAEAASADAKYRDELDAFFESAGTGN